MDAAAIARAKRNGWYITDDEKCTSTANFGPFLQGLMEEHLSYLQQWEISRFFWPQGPLIPGDASCINEELILEWKKLPGRHIHHSLRTLAGSLPEYENEELPTSTSPSTWDALEAVGGEEAADLAGTLAYSMKIVLKDNGSPTLTIAGPVIGTSRRLYRSYPARRLLRVTIDEATERVIRDEGRAHNKQALANFLRRPLRHLGTLYRPFFYQKGAIYFWGFRQQDPPAFDYLSLEDFLSQLIPRQGLNERMTLAKYSARISLWLSKTTPIIPVQDIRWVPDLTNHTLAIGPKMLRHIALKVLELGYVPSCLAGTCEGKPCTWALDYDIESHKIQVFEEEADDLPKVDDEEEQQQDQDGDEDEDEEEESDPDELFSFTFQAFAGPQREEVWEEFLIKRRDIEFEKSSKYPEEIMTDGNALMSYGLALAVCEARKMEAIPSAVQARIGGSKGLWTLEPRSNDSDKSVWIEIRESQHKYHESVECDWIFEVVNCSGPSKPASIGPQLLGVLARAQSDERNVRLLQYLSTLLDSEIKKSCDSLLDIRDRALLRKALESLDRRLRTREGESSRDGAQTRFSTREDEDSDPYNMSLQSGDDEHAQSGQPTTLAAQAIKLLDSGFDLDDPTLLTLLNKLLNSTIDTNVASQRICVPKSRVLYVATDTLGLLKPGQVFVQLSEGSIIDDKTKRRRNGILKGPVLITRSPCVQPTDIQKVEAVDIPEYHDDYFDVIICPTQGRRAFLSLLSGGDYDGDTVLIIWDENIVSGWANARISRYLKPPYAEGDYWNSYSVPIETENVDQVEQLEFLSQRYDALAKDELLSEIMLASLYTPTHYGILSEQHKQLLRNFGPHHPETIKMGHLYCQALDAGKAGKVLKPEFRQNPRSLQNRQLLQELADGDTDFADNRGNHSPSKRAAQRIGDLSLDDQASDDIDDVQDEEQEPADSDESEGEYEEGSQSPRSQIINSLHAELARPEPPRRSVRLQQKRVREESEDVDEDSEEQRDELEDDAGIDGHLADLSEEHDITEQENAAAKHLLDVDTMRRKAKSLKAVIAKKPGRLSDNDIMPVWTTFYLDKGNSKETSNYLKAMLKHVEDQANRYVKFKWLSAPPPPELARDVSTHEQVRQKRAYFRSRDLQRGELVADFWAFEPDVEALLGHNFENLMASCAYCVASQNLKYNDFPFLVAFAYLTNIKADAVELSSARQLPAHRVVSAVYDTLHSRLKLPKETAERKGEHVLAEMLASNEEKEGSPSKKRRVDGDLEAAEEQEFEKYLEDGVWPESASEGGSTNSDDELHSLMRSVGIDDSGIGGSQGVYA